MPGAAPFSSALLTASGPSHSLSRSFLERETLVSKFLVPPVKVKLLNIFPVELDKKVLGRKYFLGEEM